MEALPFNKFSKNIYSQNGEDGILAEILLRLRIGTKDSWCVEFGAWDGILFSNTFALVEQGWNAVYIEGNPVRYRDLLNTKARYQKIIAIEAFVARQSNDENSLDKLLISTKIPKDFDLLSIDIDSYDCDVWESLSNYEPKIVVIEINSSVLPGILWRHSGKTSGNSFSSTLNVGKSKGYTLVCHTGNLIFVRNDLFHKLDFPQRYIDFPELLFLIDWIKVNREKKQLRTRVRSAALVFTPKPLLPLAMRFKKLLKRPGPRARL
jgi:hypothetical protein